MYEDEDYDTPMVSCMSCEHWVHIEVRKVGLDIMKIRIGDQDSYINMVFPLSMLSGYLDQHVSVAYRVRNFWGRVSNLNQSEARKAKALFSRF